MVGVAPLCLCRRRSRDAASGAADAGSVTAALLLRLHFLYVLRPAPPERLADPTLKREIDARTTLRRARDGALRPADAPGRADGRRVPWHRDQSLSRRAPGGARPCFPPAALR